MRARCYLLAAICLLSVLAGCSSSRPPDIIKPVPAQITSKSSAEPEATPAVITPVEGQAQAAGVEAIPVEPLPRPVMSGNRAVVALLDRAQHDVLTGKREAAGASLERALRIEPRNPWLWHELAQLRLTQGQYAQAITLAKKSNSFAGGQRRVQAENWQVIGNAQIAQGDNAAAELAFKMNRELQQ